MMPNRDAIFPTEKVTFPTIFAADDDDHLTKENTIFVDAFLYDAAAEEAMVEEGLLPTAFCNGKLPVLTNSNRCWLKWIR